MLSIYKVGTLSSRILNVEGSSPLVSQTRNALLWADWRMAKDVRKRKTLAEYSDDKLRINALRKNNILPQEIRSIADQQINELPRDAVGIRIRGRCAFTSRGNGNVMKWRVSRIVFRDLADRNELSGTQRAIW